MGKYLIELHEKATRRGRAEVLQTLSGELAERGIARRTAQLVRPAYKERGTVVERWVP